MLGKVFYIVLIWSEYDVCNIFPFMKKQSWNTTAFRLYILLVLKALKLVFFFKIFFPSTFFSHLEICLDTFILLAQYSKQLFGFFLMNPDFVPTPPATPWPWMLSHVHHDHCTALPGTSTWCYSSQWELRVPEKGSLLLKRKRGEEIALLLLNAIASDVMPITAITILALREEQPHQHAEQKCELSLMMSLKHLTNLRVRMYFHWK